MVRSSYASYSCHTRAATCPPGGGVCTVPSHSNRRAPSLSPLPRCGTAPQIQVWCAVTAVLCPVRLRALLVPNRLIGRQVRILAVDGRVKVLDGDEIVLPPLVTPQRVVDTTGTPHPQPRSPDCSNLSRAVTKRHTPRR